jgi:hypothetical protein
MDIVSLRALSSAPSLSGFNILLCNEVQTSAVGSYHFRDLKHASLTGTISDCTAFLASIHTPIRITGLNITLVGGLHPSELVDLSKTIQMVAGSHLSNLKISPDGSLPSSVLRPLFDCPKISSITIPIDAQNDELSDIEMQAEKAWPELVHWDFTG